jgi:sialidase-1
MRGRIALGLLLLALLVLSGCATTGGASYQDTLIGYWPLDDGSGNVAMEITNVSVDGVITGGPAWTEGVFGGALQFDGVDDTILMDTGFNIPEYTIALWVKVEFLLRQADIISMYQVAVPGATVDHGILLEVAADGALRYLERIPLGDSGGSDLYTETAYNDGTWYHVALVKSAEERGIYINGEPVVTEPDTALITDDELLLVIGCLDQEREIGRFFKGTLDDIRIYGSALTQEELLDVMAAPAVIAAE